MVETEIVDIDDRVDPDADLHQRLIARRDVQQQDLFLARRVQRFGRRRGSEDLPIGLGRQHPERAIAQAVELRGRLEDAIES